MAEEKNKWWAVFAYFLGLLSGIIAYFLKKEDMYVRFHAVQSIILNVVIMVLSTVTFGIGALFLAPIIFILWLFLMYKAYKGEKYMLPVIGEYAEKYSKA